MKQLTHTNFYLNLCTIGVDIEIAEKHIGEIADFMAEWEGPIAENLKLRKSDVEEIKAKYPQKLNLQK